MRLLLEGKTWRRGSAAVLFAAALMLAGCTVGPKYRRPQAEVPTIYKEAGNWKTAQPNEQNLGGNWWEIFQDAQLNGLEQQVTVSNQNLKAAEAQYRQAGAMVRYNRADYFPTLSVAPNATRNKISSNTPPANALSNGKTLTDIQLPFEVSYEVDAWGRIRSNVAASRAEAQASAADLAAVNLSMHAQLAMFYFQARTLDAQEQRPRRSWRPRARKPSILEFSDLSSNTQSRL